MRAGSFVALIILSLGVTGYGVGVYTLLPPGAAVHPDMRASFEAHHAGILYAHVFVSAIALALGPFQFWAGLRAARPALHRWSGRLYLGSVAVGGVAGLLAAFGAFGGPVARLGFACLAAAWLFSAFKAYEAIRARDIALHRRWMVRNFALTFAAVTLRLWLPALFVAGVPMSIAYPIIAWLCWLPNLAVAELAFNSGRGKPLPQ